MKIRSKLGQPRSSNSNDLDVMSKVKIVIHVGHRAKAVDIPLKS